MGAITIKTTVNEPLVRALPALKPLLGKSIRLVAEEPAATRPPSITWDEFVRHHQLQRPPNVAPVSLDDMERAIAEGASGDES